MDMASVYGTGDSGFESQLRLLEHIASIALVLANDYIRNLVGLSGVLHKIRTLKHREGATLRLANMSCSPSGDVCPRPDQQ